MREKVNGVDMLYGEYQDYLHALLEPQGICGQVENTEPSSKFHFVGGRWQVAPFRGYTVITPPFAEDRDNDSFYFRMADLQLEIVQRFGLDRIGFLPAYSFHLTLTDILSASGYDKFVKEHGSDEEILHQVNDVFSCLPEMPAPRLRPVGVCAPISAVILIMDFCSEEDYRNVVELRQALHRALGLNIRSYLAHTSLFYKMFNGVQAASLADILIDVNQQMDWDSFPTFTVPSADLRYFPNMHHFVRDKFWPRYTFGK